MWGGQHAAWLARKGVAASNSAIGHPSRRSGMVPHECPWYTSKHRRGADPMREGEMPKYLARGNYVGDGIKGLMAEGGTTRQEAVQASLESLGGTLDCLYYAFGDIDVFGIADFPDDASAAAWSLQVNSTGAVSVNLTPLMTPEDLDAAAAKTPAYRAPGA